MALRDLALAALVACSPSVVRAPMLDVQPIAVLDKTIHGDTRFDTMERIVIEWACGRWFEFTHGRVRLGVVWDYDELTLLNLADEPHLVRSPQYLGSPNGGRVDGNEIRLIPAQCPELVACALHELGHFVGMRHVATERSVMSARNPAADFNDADLVECISHRLCEAKRR